MKSVDQQLAALAARIANLEQAPVVVGHNFRDHADVDLQGAVSGTGVAYGTDGFWRPGSGGSSVAYLNNSDGAIGGSGGDFQEWDQLATRGDTSWFEFPTDYWGPSDRAAFRIVQPGIFTVIARVTGSGLASVELTGGANGTLAERGAGDVADSLCGSGMFIAEQVEPADYQVILIETTGADPVFSQVAIEFWPGEPAFTQF